MSIKINNRAIGSVKVNNRVIAYIKVNGRIVFSAVSSVVSLIKSCFGSGKWQDSYTIFRGLINL